MVQHGLAGETPSSPAELPAGGDERGLDPLDWSAFRKTAHGALDAALDRLARIASEPVWQPVPDDLRSALATAMPRLPAGPDAVAAEALALMPYATGNIHPRFFGWVHGTGTPGGVVAEMLAAARRNSGMDGVPGSWPQTS